MFIGDCSEFLPELRKLEKSPMRLGIVFCQFVSSKIIMLLRLPYLLLWIQLLRYESLSFTV